MQHKYSKQRKVHEFSVGESASLRIPRIDRAATDLQRLPCVVVMVTGKAQMMYRLRCSYGVLNRCYRASDLEPFSAGYSTPVDGWEEEPRISLRDRDWDLVGLRTLFGRIIGALIKKRIIWE